jgi:hypothetical protein
MTPTKVEVVLKLTVGVGKISLIGKRPASHHSDLPEGLEDAVRRIVGRWNDGRYQFSVEMVQKAVGEIVDEGVRDAVEAELRRDYPVCRINVSLRVPRGGDGSLLVVGFHHGPTSFDAKRCPGVGREP